MNTAAAEIQNTKITAFIIAAGLPTELSQKQIFDVCGEGITKHGVWRYCQSLPKVKRGVFDVTSAIAAYNGDTDTVVAEDSSVDIAAATVATISPVAAPVAAAPVQKQALSSISNIDDLSIKTDASYVPWGHFSDISKILKSKSFFPVFITGPSGNGKTFMVEQSCAKTGRDMVRVQISPETDEDDLIGGWSLVDGETVYREGPVIMAMKKGAVLLLDEIDRGSNKIMCLQGILEGKPVLIKKTGQIVTPAAGFNVIATANTKGQGSDSGRFSAATIIDEAFLERFNITMEQPWATPSQETKIVKAHIKKYQLALGGPENFAEQLVNWASIIRKTFADGGVDEEISTRRLCHIVQTYGIFANVEKSIKLCISRYDDDTKAAFIDLFAKMTPADYEGMSAEGDAIDAALDQVLA